MEQRMAETQRQANESRLRLLESQLEPHMLFNTLANLRALISADPVRAQAMLDHLIAYLRATLSASRTGTHTLEQEFARLRDYLELMAIRMGPRLQFTLDLPDALKQVSVPPLLLQPIVENSIQHGLEPQVQGGSIVVRAGSGAGVLTLEVSDTGKGLDVHATPADGKGFGMRQVRERLATLYGDAAAIEFIAASAGGTRARITIPLKS
jgi:LytS/YehU family sensor histidine kinase